MSIQRTLSTPHGDALLVVDRSKQPVGTLLLNHGAGGGIDSADLVALAGALPRHGISVLRLEQPWKVAGKRLAPRPQVLDDCLVAVANQIRPRTPLVIGGRSAGARAAARCAQGLGATGFLALAFPLHPPGKPERSRLEELTGAGLPTLVIQGERDTFGRPGEFPADCDLAVVPAADHGFRVPRRAEITQEEALGIIVEATLEWIVRDVVGNRTGR
ncbi:MAG TPA: alpha/beta family hydrolase [Nocardioidaceae bacterium]|nr:alpha/beta family hydrolase [Nocardioidaceae bacterium]